MKKKDYKNLIILEVIAIAMILFLTRGKYVFGSTIDWPHQHFYFADYFRKLFYSTGNLFPNFAFHIGNGQNIFYFSYYGLYSPIFLLSYLVPIINMGIFIQQAMAVLVILCTLFYYKWLRRRFNCGISFIVALVFLTASPILFHASRHIMFISYMPFILLGLYGVDAYFEKQSTKSKIMLAGSVLGIILSNYFFSIIGIFTIALYGLFVYLEKNKFSFKAFFKEGIKFLVPLLYGVFLSMFFVLPTLYAITRGRLDTNVDLSLAKLFIPNFDLSKVLYSSYNYGLGILFIFCIVHSWFSKNKSLKVLSILITIFTFFPILTYILNGFMYVEYKIFIPLIPLVGVFIGYFIDDVSKEVINKKTIFIILVLVVISSILKFKYFILFDLIAVLIGVVLLLKNKKMGQIFLVIYLCIFAFIGLTQTHLLSKEKYYAENDKKVEENITNVLNKEKNIYRFNYNDNDLFHVNYILDLNYYNSSVYSSLSNLNNKESFVNLFNNEISYRNNMILNESNNVLYNLYMGNKYLYTKNNQMYGYKKIKDDIYKNEDVLPIGYSTYKVMSLEHYKELKYPYNMEALMNYIIVDEKRMINDYKTDIIEYNYDISSLIKENKFIKEKDGKYVIENTTGNEVSIDLKMDESLKNKIMIINFDMDYNEDCGVGDQYIKILGQKNVYTCKQWKYNNENSNFNYVISLDKATDKTIVFSKGRHIISNVKMYLLDYNDVKDIKEDVDEFVFDKEKTKGDTIVGTVDTKEYGYFMLSIPYDEGFKIVMDNKEVQYEKVDQNYIGFRIKPGKHSIKITYKAPYSKAGKTISLFSLLAFCYYLFKEKIESYVEKMKETMTSI